MTLDIPEGLAIKNACHPGGSFQDPEDETSLPELLDIIEASAVIPGISADSRVVFITRRVNDAKTGILSDRVCD